MGADETVDVLKLLIVRPLDQHASRAVAAAPHDDGAIAGVTEMQPLQRLRSLVVGCDDRRRTFRQRPRGQNHPGGGRHTDLQKASTRGRNRFTHETLLLVLAFRHGDCRECLYLADDLVIPTWNAALVYDTSGATALKPCDWPERSGARTRRLHRFA